MKHALVRVFLMGLLCLCALAGFARTVTIGTINMPPHSVEDEAQESFSRALFTEAFRSQGWEVRIAFYPWARAFQMGKLGEVDAVWPSIRQAEREEWFVFGQPVLNTNYVLLKRKDFAFKYAGLADAKPWLIGVLRGGITGSILDGANDYRTEAATTFEQNVQKLGSARIELMTSERYNGLYLLHTGFPELAPKIEMLLPPISSIAFYLMFSKKAPDGELKRLAFDKGLQLMRANGRYQALLTKFGYDPSAGTFR